MESSEESMTPIVYPEDVSPDSDSRPDPQSEKAINESMIERRLSKRHFENALKEIRPSTSEEGTLPELRKVSSMTESAG